MDELSKVNDYVDELNVIINHVYAFEDTPEVHMIAQVKEDFVNTYACASIYLNVMSNLEVSTIVLNIVEQPVHNHYVLCIDKLTGFKG